MSNNINIDEIIDLATLLLSEKNSEEFVQKLESYSQAFGDWFSAYQESAARGEPINTPEDLERLLEVHEKLVEESDKMHGTLPDEMAKLKLKGKGILAYTDTLPKKISFTKAKKG